MRLTDFWRPPLELSGAANYGMCMHGTAANTNPLGFDVARGVERIRAMRFGWCKLMDSWQGEAGRRLVAAGIMPICRPYMSYTGAADIPADVWEHMHAEIAVTRYIEAPWNEPNLEAGHGPGALDYYRQLFPKWRAYAESVLSAGGLPSTPAEAPGGAWGWRDGLWALLTLMGEAGCLSLFGQGLWVAVHNYSGNHPTDYPYDERNQRDHPGATLEQDSFAFTMPLEAHRVLRQFIGDVAAQVPIISTEGGPYAENQEDNRYPLTTLARYSDLVLEQREYMATEAPDWWLVTTQWLIEWDWGLGSPGFQKHAWYSPDWPGGRMPICGALETLPALARNGAVTPEPEQEEKPPDSEIAPEPPSSMPARWRLVSVRRLTPEENHGRNLIIFEPPDVPMLVRWATGETVQTKEMWYGRGQYTVQVAGADSDVATVPGTDFPDDPPYQNDQGEWVLGNSNGHFSDVVTFEQEVSMPDVDWPGATWHPSTNGETGRAGGQVEMVVLHWTAGPYAAALATLTRPGGASAHYILDRDGAWTQLVRESDTAWHAGDYGVNQRSIGIETVADANNPPTEAQYEALAAFLKAKAGQYGIAISRETVKGHREIVATQCPGSLDIERVVSMAIDTLQGPPWYTELTPQQMVDKLVEYEGVIAEYHDRTEPALRQEIAALRSERAAQLSVARQLVTALEV